jgi:hypothetical protein
MHTIGRFTLRTLGVIFALVLFVIVINLSTFDQVLEPELEELLQTRPSISLEGNAYTVMMGLDAASDRDPFMVGASYITEVRKHYAAGERTSLAELARGQFTGGSGFDDEWMAHYPSLNCNPRQQLGCLDKLKAEVAEHPNGNKRTHVLLERYHHILEQPHFEEIDELKDGFPVPPYHHFLQLGRLQLAIHAHHQDAEAFIAALEKDIRFWRMVLIESKSLMAKMVAVAGLWTDLQYVSEFAATTHLEAAQLKKVQHLIQPLTTAELDIGEAFLTEQRYFSDAQLDHIPAPKRWVIALTLQENATLNLMHSAFTQPIVALSKGSGSDFYEALQVKRSRAEKKHYRIFPPTLYNLGGKLLISEGAYRADDYIARIHDLNTLFSLVSLQIDIELSSTSNISNYLQTSKQRDEVRGETFVYDKARNELSFRCLRPENNCSIRM